MNFNIQIFSDFQNPSLKYTLDFIFHDALGIEYRLTNRESELNKDHPVISYSRHSTVGLHIIPSDYLSHEDFLTMPNDSNSKWNSLPIIFENNGAIPFDLFSAVFFLLSRAEEYNHGRLDEHKRFVAERSWAYRHQALEFPIVDLWVESFKKLLTQEFGNIDFKKHQYQWYNTYDVDIAFAHLYRPLSRTVGGAVKSGLTGDFTQVLERLKVLSGRLQDPYDTFDYQRKTTAERASKNIYFFLCGGNTKYDNALDINHRGMKSLIERLSKYSEIGIHPSYNTPSDVNLLRREVSILQNILEDSVSSSRQHFLRLNLPKTYRNLLASGITQDFSMGFANRIGFRSGTSRPHFFFDLEANAPTNLQLFPLQLMDGTLIEYMKLDPYLAVERAKKLIEQIKAVGGVFVSLWHNHILTKHSPWKNAYEQIADIAADK